MKLLNKEIVKKLKELSNVSKTVTSLKKQKSGLEEELLNSDEFKEYSSIISGYGAIFDARKKELTEQIKEEEIQREMLREEIVFELQEEYDGENLDADVPTVGKVKVKMGKKKVFEPDSVPLSAVLEKLLETGDLSCVSIDKGKYEELAKEYFLKNSEDLPGIVEKDTSTITIKESKR